MPYIALKPTKFDREYMIGETIPDHVVDPSRAVALVGMKLIAAIAAAEPVQGPAGDADGEGKADAPQTDENGAEGAQEPAEPAAEPTQEPAGDATEVSQEGVEHAEPAAEPEKKSKSKAK